jgi:uncharacterized protein (DUF2126 family)
MLPAWLLADLEAVLAELDGSALGFQPAWFAGQEGLFAFRTWVA